MDNLEANPNKIKRSFGLPFYWTCKFLRKETAKDVCLIYAFYQYAKDLAMAPSPKRAKELLGKLEEELECPTHTFMIRFEEALSRLGIKKAYAKEVISAARFEVSGKRLQDHNQLMVYSYKDMGALGLMLAPALGATNSKVMPYAVDLGIGASLVRICSAVLPDAERGQIFFPKREMDILKLNDEELLSEGETPIELKKLVSKHLDIANEYLESARSGLAFLPFKVRFGMLMAINGCQELCRKIRRHDYEVLEGDISLSSLNKTALTLKTFSDMLKPSFWLGGRKRAYLHHSLSGLPGVNAK